MEENGPKPPEFLKKYLDELHKVYNESDKYHEIGFVGMLKKFAEDDLKSCYYFNKRIKFHYLSRSVLKHYNYDNQLIEQASCSSIGPKHCPRSQEICAEEAEPKGGLR